MDKRPADIDAYLATLPPDARAGLEKVRRAIRAAAPQAVEAIAYGMPAFKYRGRPLIYFAASKRHSALYGPAVAEFEEELAGYDVSKGTVRFPPSKPPPASLVRRLVRARMAAIDAAATKR